jgi:hypothetical protein
MNQITNVIKHTKFIYQYDNFVSEKECEKLLKLIKKSNIKEKEINLSKESSSNKKIKDLDDSVHELISDVHQQYLKNNKFLQYAFSFDHYSSLSCDYFYCEYEKQDKIDWTLHDTRKPAVLSYYLCLNSDFEGGDFLFLIDGKRVSFSQGTVLCFPCTMQMIFKQTPIIKGKKKVIYTVMQR